MFLIKKIKKNHVAKSIETASKLNNLTERLTTQTGENNQKSPEPKTKRGRDQHLPTLSYQLSNWCTIILTITNKINKLIRITMISFYFLFFAIYAG